MKKLQLSLREKVQIFLIVFILAFAGCSAAMIYLTAKIENDISSTITKSDEIVSTLHDLNKSILQAQLYLSIKKHTLSKKVKARHDLALGKIYEEQVPMYQFHLQEKANEFTDSTSVITNNELIESLNTISILYKEIKDEKSTFSTEYNSEIYINTTYIIKRIGILIAQISKEKNEAIIGMQSNFHKIYYLLIIINIVIILFIIYANAILKREFTQPILEVKEVIKRLENGEQPEKLAIVNEDEIGEISNSVNKLVEGIKSITKFAEKIGKGELSTDFTPLSDKDILGNSLIRMKQNLSRLSIEDSQRNWANIGLAKFNNLLRENNETAHQLTTHTLPELINYLDVNQGSFYTTEMTSEGTEVMALKAKYAWDRRKYHKDTIRIGEGFVGQAWIEKDTINLTDIPEKYITIKSGFGDAPPRNIIIVPLIHNDRVFGVIELASFNVLEDFKVNFLNNLSVNIASTLATLKSERL